ncbi:YCF48-related protein [Desulfosarcina ovata]|uniref:Photosynthesis system II assembly factor Ycf48/Hcf136-like domain-containing protein n=1 Tax=Desulfosarcina ovata subsp. ovata TaxID=2752305 RepID=A0A5K8AB14_9BACT|nr:YCF48-related protein [Desulfosarcina ovata]BBO89721.1 hypothetical protein DSCOOX_29010 [Desulfosarcina ovata subsp. ovata]
MSAPKVHVKQAVSGGRQKIAAGWVIGCCLVVFVAATVYALKQIPRPDPFKPASFKETFLFPYEENAFMRLPMVSGNLNDVVIVPGSGVIWAVGGGGLILVSRDKGKSWMRRPFPAGVEIAGPPEARKNAGLNLLGWGVRPASAADQPAYRQESKKSVRDIRQQVPVKTTPEKLPEKPQPQEPPENTPLRVPDLQTVFFVDDTCGWIAGEGGTILGTSDGGRTWQAQPSGTAAGLSDLHFTDRGHGWACGDNGTILSTTDGGQRWQEQDRVTRDQLFALHFADQEHGWACGDNGTILSTTNGGKIWREQSSGRYPRLSALDFTDAEHGWICGEYGLILLTTDGGRNWDEPASGTTTDLHALHFTDPKHGWAGGKEGVLLSTGDGGRTWQVQSSGTAAGLSALDFKDAEHGWACGSDGTFLSTADGGRTWRPQSSGTAAGLSALHFTDNEHGWAGGFDGTLLSTADGGRSWHPQPSGITADLSALTFMDAEHGWAGGSDGTLLSTTDGGRTWHPQSSGTDVWLSALTFTDAEHGWAGGFNGTLLSTTDGGQSWRAQSSGTDAWLSALYFTDGEHGWACGSGGTLLSTIDGGQTWQVLFSDARFYLRDLYFTDDEHGWACGSGGTILSTVDGGRTWQVQTSGTTAYLFALHFSDHERGWVSGENGTLLSTVDGGRTWRPQSSGTAADLRALDFTDGGHGHACGSGGTLLSTVNGSRTWTLPTYRRLPAPWYWSLCLVLIIVSLFVVQRRGWPEAAGETVADLLASDRPLAAGDPDPLDLGSIAAGMARFIANRNTDPPLTMAVTGEWGTGKSSLMNLLLHDLKMRRFHPVWFNAWHHQKGEQLLASLYAHIRRQAIPPLWHPGGILFRLRLLFRRGRRNRLAFASLAFLLFAAYPFLEGLVVSLIGTLGALVQALLAGNPDEIRHLFSLSDLIPDNPDNWIGALLASPAVAAAWRGIRAFGLSPQRLLTLGATEGGRKGGLDPGARAHFAQEFEDVAASLDLGAMVIFIDDLDRCTKENVVEILETINFLAASGRCFIILGMARQWVETCVALQFKELAEETNNGNDGSKDGFAHRRRFAQQYLEKLINIEVPVPVPSADATRALLTPKVTEPPSLLVRILTACGRTVKKQIPVLCLAVLATLAWYLWRIIPDGEPEQKPAETEDLLVLPAATGGGEVVLDDGRIRIPLDALGSPPGSQDGRALEIVLKGARQALEEGLPIGTLGRDDRKAELVLRHAPRKEAATPATLTEAEPDRPTPAPEEKPTGKAGFRPGATDESPTGLWLALLAGLGFVVIGGRYLVLRPRRFTKDSRTFRDALAIWHPWIVLLRRTPRTIKRFLNRLRYVAMRLRSEPENLSLWERIWRWAIHRRDDSAAEKRSEGVPEPVLVALGAVYHVNPEWVKDEAVLRDLFSETSQDLIDRLTHAFDLVADTDPAVLADTAAKLKAAFENYRKTFGHGVESLIRHRDAFLAVLAETGL